MIQAGLRKALRLRYTAVGSMESGGWQLPMFAAFMVTAGRNGGWHRPAAGFADAAAACAVVAAMIDAWAVNVSAAAFWSDPFNVPFLIAVGAGALLFTGAGPLLRRRQDLRKLALWAVRCPAGNARRGDRRGAC